MDTPEQQAPQKTLEEQLVELQDKQKVMEQKFDSLISWVNERVQELARTVDAVDNTAFGALALHEGKEYVVSPEVIANTRVHIDNIIKENNAYRDKLQEEAKKKRAKEEKAAAKKAEVKKKRDARKGKAPKKVKKDEAVNKD